MLQAGKKTLCTKSHCLEAGSGGGCGGGAYFPTIHQQCPWHKAPVRKVPSPATCRNVLVVTTSRKEEGVILTLTASLSSSSFSSSDGQSHSSSVGSWLPVRISRRWTKAGTNCWALSELLILPSKSDCPFPTLRALLSSTFLQTVPDLVTPLKGHSLSPRSCPLTRSAPSERFGY